jgi:hypothetical protein
MRTYVGTRQAPRRALWSGGAARTSILGEHLERFETAFARRRSRRADVGGGVIACCAAAEVETDPRAALLSSLDGEADEAEDEIEDRMILACPSPYVWTSIGGHALSPRGRSRAP